MMAALGVTSRPATSRTRARKASSTRSQVPSSRHFRKYHQTEVPPDCAPGRQVMGHQTPGYAAAQHVQDAVDHLTQVCGPGMASPGVGRQQGSQFLPLGVGEIAGIRFSAHAPSVTSTPSSPQEPTLRVSPIVTHPLSTSASWRVPQNNCWLPSKATGTSNTPSLGTLSEIAQTFEEREYLQSEYPGQASQHWLGR